MFQRKYTLLKNYFTKEKSFINNKIILNGWIDSMRVQGNNSLAFIKLNDGSCLNSIQIVVNSENFKEEKDLDDIFKRGTKGVSIYVEGLVKESPASGQLTEIEANKIVILGDTNASEYPIAKKKLPLEHIRKIPHLRVRTRVMSSVLRLRHSCSKFTHDFFHLNDFTYVHTPILTSNDCEGAGETFNLKNTLKSYKPIEKENSNNIHQLVEEPFFSKEVNLTVSGQLHGETLASGLGNIYTFGPTFRAENSNTTRHLAEFWMIEPEACFIDLNDLMNLTEDYIKYVIKHLLEHNLSELEFFTEHFSPNLLQNLKLFLSDNFIRISYTEAIDTLLKEIEDDKAIVRDTTIENKKFKKKAKGKHIFENDIFWGVDMSSEHEKYLTDVIYKKPVFVYNYPKKIKSFYMKSNGEEENETVQATDLLVPGIGELVGGSIREDDYEKMKEIMESKNIEIDWYLDLRKYGSVPHGGFGLGFERLLLLVTGLSNIRDIIPYPRAPRSCLC